MPAKKKLNAPTKVPARVAELIFDISSYVCGSPCSANCGAPDVPTHLFPKDWPKWWLNQTRNNQERWLLPEHLQKVDGIDYRKLTGVLTTTGYRQRWDFIHEICTTDKIFYSGALPLFIQSTQGKLLKACIENKVWRN